jgi:hypothetical protein
VYTSARTVYVPCPSISTTSSQTLRQEGTYRRNLPGDVDVLGERHLALVERALEVRLANRVAAVGLLVDEGDEPVLDLQVHHEALLDLVLEGARGLDGELLTTADVSAMSLCRSLLLCETYGFGGLGSRSAFSIFRMSSAGSPQK